MKIHLIDTVAELDAKIAAAQKSLQLATEQFNYLRQARAILASPLALDIPFHLISEDVTKVPETPTYGGLKRSVFSCLSETDGNSPQAIVEIMQSQGYVFRSKTPAISVNEALQTLRTEGKAELSGKSTTGANLWIKSKGALEPSDNEGEETPAEAGV